MEGGREGGKEGGRVERLGSSCVARARARAHTHTHTHTSSGTWARGQVIQWMAASQGGIKVR